MTVATADRSAELFDTLDTLELPHGYRAEILKEEIVMSPTPAGRHQRNVMELLGQLLPRLPDGYEIEVNLEIRMPYLGRSAIPDLFVAPNAVLDTDSHHVPPDDVLLVAEVVSRSNAENDRELKRKIYPAAAIPVYLLIDPIIGSTTRFTMPENGEYREATTVPFGRSLSIPEPIAVELDTSRFLSY